MKAFLGTTLGKIVIGVLAAAVVAGGGYGIYQAVQPDTAPVAAITDPTEAPITTKAETTAEEHITEATILTTIATPTTDKPTITTKPTTMTATTTATAKVASSRPDIILKYADGGTSPYNLVWVDKQWGGDANNGPGNIAKGYYEYQGNDLNDLEFSWPDDRFWDQWVYADPMGQGGAKMWTVKHNYPGVRLYLHSGDRFIIQDDYQSVS